MGFNTVVLVCNDAMGVMKDNPQEFVSEIISGSNQCYKSPYGFGLGYYSNGFEVISCQHADIVSLIAVGGNYSTVLGNYMLRSRGHHTIGGKVEVLRRAADDLGYRLVKKAPKK